MGLHELTRRSSDLRVSSCEVSRSDAGRSALPHHIKCGGGYSGAALGDRYGVECGTAGRAWTRG